MRITVKGLKEANARLKQLEDAVEAERLKTVLYKAIDLVRAEALRNVQALTKAKTGNLQKSLIAKPGKSNTYASAFVKAAGRIAPHAHLIEYGHRIVKKDAGGKYDTGKTVAPRPFFRPALDAKRAEVRRAVIQGIKQLLMGTFAAPMFNEPDAPSGWMGPDETGWIG